MGGNAREAIVVDGKSRIMADNHQTLADKLKPSSPEEATITEEQILNHVMHAVQAVMPYNGSKVSELSEAYKTDRLISLSTYLEQGAGVCRHQALLAGYFIERLIGEGLLIDSVGVECNSVPDLGGAHAWALFSNISGNQFVIDSAQSFVGSKRQARQQNRWEYALEEPVSYGLE